MSGSSPEGLARALRDNVEAALSLRLARSVEILKTAPVAGGCIHQTARLSTNLGEDFFLKWAGGGPSDVFAAEADGLDALREHASLTVPEVIATSAEGESPSWLLLEYVPQGSPAKDYAEGLGRGLAKLHEPREGLYGWHRSNYIGSLPQSNASLGEWPAFWWAERLEPQWALASDRGLLAGLEGEWSTLESRLASMLGSAAEDGCSLLHGDLWSGNVYPGPEGRAVLVDPAVYRGHREVDLAMTELFGGFEQTFYIAYEDSRPLTEGYESVRRHVYQLYPLLVHVNLFGDAYVNGVARALRSALRAG